jgi:hypothetical protein
MEKICKMYVAKIDLIAVYDRDADEYSWEPWYPSQKHPTHRAGHNFIRKGDKFVCHNCDDPDADKYDFGSECKCYYDNVLVDTKGIEKFYFNDSVPNSDMFEASR